MKILYVNWVPSKKFPSIGGGVSIYQTNLFNGFKNTSDDIFYLTAGHSYNILRPGTYLRKKSSSKFPHITEYEIVNSPLLAPSFFSFDNMSDLFEDTKIQRIFGEFLLKHGPFDIVHFNNLEGFPITVLDVKKDFPTTKFIYSMHNYFPFCPQVNLWYRDSENCCDYKDGERCTKCNIFPIDRNYIKVASSFNSRLPVFFYRVFRKLRKIMHLAPQPLLPEAQAYKNRREKIVETLNKNIDVFLSVSERVKEVASRYGLDASKNQVLYIGTKYPVLSVKPKAAREALTICYLGYMRPDKGYDFFVRSLQKLPYKYRKKINIVIAAPLRSLKEVRKFDKLRESYYGLTYYRGYTHKQLPAILADVDVGIIPVQWEDNLPQIAYEFLSHNIPYLTSDLGGAKELFTCDDFVFNATDMTDFQTKLMNIVDDRQLILDFWQNINYDKINSVQAHISALLNLYKSLASSGLVAEHTSQD